MNSLLYRSYHSTLWSTHPYPPSRLTFDPHFEISQRPSDALTPRLLFELCEISAFMTSNVKPANWYREPNFCTDDAFESDHKTVHCGGVLCFKLCKDLISLRLLNFHMAVCFDASSLSSVRVCDLISLMTVCFVHLSSQTNLEDYKGNPHPPFQCICGSTEPVQVCLWESRSFCVVPAAR